MRSKIIFPGANPLAAVKRPGETRWFRGQEAAMEKAMKRTLIRYKTKPEMTDANAELIAAVFAELKAVQPDGTRYLSLRLEDDTFIHFVETAADDGTSALPKLAAFRPSRAGFASVAPNRRWSAARPSLAIIACWASLKRLARLPEAE
jgi:hypothetical protein